VAALKTPATSPALERVFLWFGKAMVALAIGFVVLGFLMMSFFSCCGLDSAPWLNPRTSPYGPYVTIFLVWPAMGAACLLAQGLLSEIPSAFGWLRRRISRPWHG
jgi:hypothetical protein